MNPALLKIDIMKRSAGIYKEGRRAG